MSDTRLRCGVVDAGALLTGAGLWAYAFLFAMTFMDGVPFLGAVVPGYVTLVGAGAAAQFGFLDAGGVLILGFLGAFAGDLVAFGAGRRFGPGLLARLPVGARSRASALRDAFSENLGKSLVLGRFIGLTRALASPLAGSSGVCARRFCRWSAFGTSVWTAKAFALGWLVAAGAGYVEGPLAHFGLAATVLATVGIGVAVERRVRARFEPCGVA